MADQPKATFPINLEGNAAAQARDLTAAIEKSDAAIKDMQGSLRRLRGSSDDVVKAKGDLKAKLDAERKAMSDASLALLKQGSSYDKARDLTKKLTAETHKFNQELKDKAKENAEKESKALATATGSIGGPLSSVTGRASKFSSVLEGVTSVEGLAVVGAGAAAAAFLALGAALAYGVASLAKFIFTSQNAARSANLLRVGATGAETSAYNLGTQIDELANKVPTAKTEINDLGVELARAGLRGKTIVDTLNAITQASSAAGPELANTLKEMVERGRMSGRLQVSPQELFGKGLDFSDLSAALAEQMHTTMADASAALAEGRVPLEQGSAALRAAVEKKFAGVNLAKMLDAGVLVEKFDEKLSMLTKGVNVEPILKDVSELMDLFDPSKSVAGAALKEMVTSLGTGMVNAAHAAAPIVKDFIRTTILGALKLGIAWFNLEIAVKKNVKNAFGGPMPTGWVTKLSVALPNMTELTYALGAGVSFLKGNFATISFTVRGVRTEFDGVSGAITGVKKAFDHIAWSDLGAQIIAGLVGPLKKGVDTIKDASGGLAHAVSTGFTGPLEIKSPSRKMMRHGRDAMRGALDGIEADAPKIKAALDVSPSAPSTPSIRGSAGGPKELHLHVHLGNAKDAAAAVTSPQFLEPLRKALQDALRCAGQPVPA